MATNLFSKKVVKLARKFFNIQKPTALAWGEWDKWHANTKKEHRIGYFITETIPDIIAKLSIRPAINEVRIWISNVLYHTHGLPAPTLKMGRWYEFDKRMLHSCFGAFANFVEMELALHAISWSDKEYKKYRIPWYRKLNFRCAQAGIDYLKWEVWLAEDGIMTSQAKAAIETLTLYTWWKQVRLNRVDPFKKSGLEKFHDEMTEKYGDEDTWFGLGRKSCMTADESATYDQLSELQDLISCQYEEEDTQMLHRLISHRSSLWT